ncbi:hypothetical protein Bbelb_402250 [Branchiostoma belcheri]|nr:hypothetical protein Bbelb_402250 [Branchiostoma belcheri]
MPGLLTQSRSVQTVPPHTATLRGEPVQNVGEFPVLTLLSTALGECRPMIGPLEPPWTTIRQSKHEAHTIRVTQPSRPPPPPHVTQPPPTLPNPPPTLPNPPPTLPNPPDTSTPTRYPTLPTPRPPTLPNPPDTPPRYLTLPTPPRYNYPTLPTPPRYPTLNGALPRETHHLLMTPHSEWEKVKSSHTRR